MSMPEHPDLLLAQKAARGDGEAFTLLFQQNFQAVYNYAVALCGDSAAAEDLTQEAFIRAHRSLPDFGPPWNFRTWIFRMTRNLFLDELRRRRPETSLDDATLLAEPLPTPESRAILKDVAGRVRQTINSLSRRNREVLVLREIQGLSYGEIAEVLNTTPAYAKTLLARSRAEFQQAYGVQLLIEEPSPDCHEVTELLQLYHDGELSTSLEPFVREHLKTCEACQKRRQWLITQSGLLAALVPMLPSADLAGRTLGRIGLRPKPAPSQARAFRPMEFVRTHPWLTALGGGALLAAFGGGMLLVLGWWFLTGPQRGPVATPTSLEFSLLPSATPEVFETANAPIVAGASETPSPTADGGLLIEIISPTPTPTPVPMATFNRNANCRRGPGTVYGVTTSLLEGQQVRADGRDAQSLWIYILVPGTQAHCWVALSSVQLNVPADVLPVIPAPPTPAPTATTKSAGPIDYDKDGFPAGKDCNDKNDKIYPGAPETPGDGIDSNCNGKDDT